VSGFQHILLVSDKESEGRIAFERAGILVKMNRAHLTIVTVVEQPPRNGSMCMGITHPTVSAELLDSVIERESRSPVR
jgi:hypothetical protein